MAETTTLQRFRVLRSQNGGEPTIGDEPMTQADAFALLGIERLLHVLGGWCTRTCSCGYGFHAVSKTGTYRQVHLVPDDLDDVLAEITDTTTLAHEERVDLEVAVAS
jgi:hypothetical protein